MKKATTLFLSATFMLQASSAMALDLRNQKHPLVSKADTKLEKKNFKKQKKAEKARERAAQNEWKKLSDSEKAQSPWTAWYRKKIVPALLELAKTRKALYRDNLFDSYIVRPDASNIVCTEQDKHNRRADGACNDLNDKLMGAAWTRLARNIDLDKSYTDTQNLLVPNPREVSLELLERDEFKPVPFLNLLAVPWIQMMTHDWFSHGENENPSKTKAVYVPLKEGDPLGKEMVIPTSMVDYTRTDGNLVEAKRALPRTYLNEVTHWWDGSPLYGSDKKTENSVRLFKDGLLAVDKDGYIPTNKVAGIEGVEKTGFNRNWWVGLNMLHNLFTKEHNAIAKALKKAHPEKGDEWLFRKARMITQALIAKIHTIEWTPAIIPNRTLRVAMGANWKGALNGSHKVKPWYELIKQDVLFGIVGGKIDLANKPFHMTEEFTSVYRMHPLLPDNLTITGQKSKKLKENLTLNDTREEKAGKLLRKHGMSDLFYSFGQMKPGQLVLNNFPKELMNISIPMGIGNIDLGAIDIFRDRERGVPRYNEFRRNLRMKPIKNFEDLFTNPESAKSKKTIAKLKRIYKNDVEMLDLMIGCLAEEHRPTGYGFGETAFQVFIIMASRRLVADRFFTTSYNAETYTKTGIKWVDDNSMKTVILRHMPELKEQMHGVRNAFNPWHK